LVYVFYQKKPRCFRSGSKNFNATLEKIKVASKRSDTITNKYRIVKYLYYLSPFLARMNKDGPKLITDRCFCSTLSISKRNSIGKVLFKKQDLILLTDLFSIISNPVSFKRLII